MLLEKDLKKIFNQLLNEDSAQVCLGSAEVTIRLFDQSSKISLSSLVYHGGNFIPISVRKCVASKPAFSRNSPIKTNLNIDEKRFQINLHYLGTVENLNNKTFKDLLEEFGYIANEWRLSLDEHGKNDLVHVYVK